MSSFGLELARQRQARGWPQMRLALEAGFDHSYVSRLEVGARKPTRAAVLALATALGCGDDDRDRLLMAANFLPAAPELLELIDDWLDRAVRVTEEVSV